MSDKPPRLGCLRIEFRAARDMTFRRDPTYLLLAALYRALDESGEVAADLMWRLHNGQPKPFALSPLILERAGGDVPAASVSNVAAGDRLRVRWSALDAATLAALPRVLVPYLVEGRTIALERGDIRVEGWSLLRPPGTAIPVAPTYADLFAHARPADEIALRFTSPVAFRRGAEPIPLDQLAARHFFGGYLERWRAFSPAEMGDRPAAELLDAIQLQQPLELWPAPPPRWPSKAPRQAAIGVARFHVEGDAGLRRRVTALANYAWYCGTGGATAFGYGQTERIPPDPVAGSQ